MESPEKVVFYYNESTVIIDNSSNAHIWYEEDTFNDNIETTISNGVATKGGKYIITKGIGTVCWYWTDDEGQMYTKKFNNALYYTDLPVNIKIATVLTESMKDDEGTWVLNKR